MSKAVRKGVASVTIEGDLHGLVDRIADGSLQRVRDAFHDTAHDVVDRARPRWPVKSGTSLRSFEVQTTITSDRVETTIRNVAEKRGRPYAYYIRLARNYGSVLFGRNAWQELVKKPAKKREKELIEDLTRDLQRLADGAERLDRG